MKKLLALILALVMTLGLATVGANAAFTDETAVAASDYSEAIAVLNGMKVFIGDENGNFNPKNSITRAEVAAIIYRIYTGDVSNAKVGNYVNLANFKDVKATDWFAGYVGYCANAQFVKGYGDGNFGPNDKVTGYQAIAMILRAVGYDKNHEFEGKGYEVEVARVAQQLGMLTKVAAEDLTLPANRDAVAQILFSAIQAPTVTYTPAFGYNQFKTSNLLANAEKNESLGWKNFKLTKSAWYDGDSWGRPQYAYYYENDGLAEGAAHTYAGTETTYATFDAAATVTYNTAIAQCDVAHDAGFATAKNFRVVLNANEVDVDNDGILNDQDYAVVPTAVNAKLGAQGRVTEVYYNYDGNGANTIVMVDTFLARVNAVAVRTYDRNNHLATPARLTLNVYSAAAAVPANAVDTVILTKTSADWEYAVGDYLLVNLQTNGSDAIATNRTGNNPAGNATGSATQAADANLNMTAFVLNADRTVNNATTAWDIVGKPETIEAAQTVIFNMSDNHTVGGKDYKDAFEFHLDPAGTATVEKMTWFFDQFGNLIGDAPIDRNSYAVLKDIIWIQGTPGHAEATVIYMDGTEAKVTVSAMDGFQFAAAGVAANEGFVSANGNNMPIIADAAAVSTTTSNISTDTIRNGDFQGLALYRVRTMDNGTVRLDAWDDDNANNAWNANDTLLVKYPHVTATATLVPDNAANAAGTAGALAGVLATVNKEISAITNTANNAAIVFVNNATKWVVRTGTAATGFTYKAYTGTVELPAMQTGSVELFYTDLNNDGVAENVYVKNYTPATLTISHIFVPVGANSALQTAAGTGVWQVNGVVVDGTVGSILTTAAIANQLVGATGVNAGKMYHAAIDTNVASPTYGQVVAINLVNEATDDTHGNLAVECDYIAQTDATYSNGLLAYNFDNGLNPTAPARIATAAGYYTNNAKVYVDGVLATDNDAALTAAATAGLNTKGIWVIFNDTVGGTYKQASEIYISTKRLATDTGLTLQYVDAAVATKITNVAFGPVASDANGVKVTAGAAAAVVTNVGGEALALNPSNWNVDVTAGYTAVAASPTLTAANGAVVTTALSYAAAVAGTAAEQQGDVLYGLRNVATAANGLADTWYMPGANLDVTTLDAAADTAAFAANATTPIDVAFAIQAAGYAFTDANQSTPVYVTAEDGWTQARYTFEMCVSNGPAAFLLGGQIGANTFNAPANDENTTLGDPATPVVGGCVDMTKTTATDLTTYDAALKALWGTSAVATAEINAAAANVATDVALAAQFNPATAPSGVFTRNAGDGFTLTLNSFSAGATVRTGYGTTLAAALADMALSTGRGTTVAVSGTDLIAGPTGSAAGFVVIRVEASDSSAITYYVLEIDNP